MLVFIVLSLASCHKKASLSYIRRQTRIWHHGSDYASCDVWKFGAYEVLQRRKVVMKKEVKTFL